MNPILDGSGKMPGTLETAITTVAGGALAGAAGTNTVGGAITAQNETSNNWLNHKPPAPGQLSEQQQYDAAVAACGQSNPTACDTAKTLRAESQFRDLALAQVCAGSGSSGCSLATAAAEAGGNVVETKNGTTYAFDPNANTIRALPSNGSYANIYNTAFE